VSSLSSSWVGFQGSPAWPGSGSAWAVSVPAPVPEARSANPYQLGGYPSPLQWQSTVLS
jgi:hypothetical protein